MSDMKETGEIRLKYEGNMGFVPNHKLDIQVSDTPRTDGGMEHDTTNLDDISNFARQLERELNVANEKIKRLEEAGDRVIYWVDASNARLEYFDALNNWKQAKEDKP